MTSNKENRRTQKGENNNKGTLPFTYFRFNSNTNGTCTGEKVNV